MKEMFSAALELAVARHSGQYDKAGKPYMLHVLKVMHYCKSDDVEINCIALLHDVIEDTKTSYAELYDIGMTERVRNAVRCLTKVPGETYEEYKAKVMSNKDAVHVKKADLRHNSDIRRLKGVTQKDIDRTIKYHQFYKELEELN